MPMPCEFCGAGDCACVNCLRCGVLLEEKADYCQECAAENISDARDENETVRIRV